MKMKVDRYPDPQTDWGKEFVAKNTRPMPDWIDELWLYPQGTVIPGAKGLLEHDKDRAA